MTTALSQATSAPAESGHGKSGLDLTALWTLYVLTLRQHLRGKRWIVATILFLLPAALAIVIRGTSPDVPPIGLEFIFAFMFIPQALLPLVALLYASGIIQDEQEEQTITYLLIRPIPKAALYAVKLMATITTTAVLTIVFTALTYAAIYVGARHDEPVMMRCAKAASIHVLAMMAYCSLFGLISLLTRRTLVVGIIYAVFFEGFLANLPLSIRLITVIYHARIIAYRTLPFLVPMSMGPPQNFAADAWQLDIASDPELLEHPTVRTCVLVLLTASLVCTILAAFICSRREFHVKTPEKAAA
jgi:ABC-2 type transport system permease protein